MAVCSRANVSVHIAAVSIVGSKGLCPFALDGSVTDTKLRELLDQQTELPWLDFKQQCEITDRRELVELAKDVGAMSILGGYLVVGADDSGRPCGMPPQHKKLFDESTLSGKLKRYLPTGFAVRSAVHDLDPGTGPMPVALVAVLPHPDGWAVFQQDGTYPDTRGREQTVFRRGDVYARHGTSSEPWSQADIAEARTRLIARAKDSWRREMFEELRRLQSSAESGAAVTEGPSSLFTWQLDAANFEAATVELIRRNDDIPVQRMLASAIAEARRLVSIAGESDADELAVVLDRVVDVGALGVNLQRPGFRELSVDALLELYGWAVEEQRVQTSRHLLVPVLWLRVAERLYGLGALAVRRRDWKTVRDLILASVPALHREYRSPSWHRDALTMANRAKLFTTLLPDGQVRQASLLLFARAAAVANPLLCPDLPDPAPEYGGRDPLLDSLCQFDLLATVVSGAAAHITGVNELLEVGYPNFALASRERATAVLDTAVLDPAVRQVLLPGVSNAELALVLDLTAHAASQSRGGFFGWSDGYPPGPTLDFIAANVHGLPHAGAV